MLRVALLFLVCALASGVFGFGAAPPALWISGKSLFPVLLVLSAACFVAGTIGRPFVLSRVSIRKPDDRKE